MNNQNQNLESRGVSLTPAQWERCDRLTDEYGKRSRNAFIREAVDGVGVDGNVIINGIAMVILKKLLSHLIPCCTFVALCSV